jgi:hypothetical protein
MDFQRPCGVCAAGLRVLVPRPGAWDRALSRRQPRELFLDRLARFAQFGRLNLMPFVFGSKIDQIAQRQVKLRNHPRIG